ncbi:aminoglycoside phosphotransferase family protein [Rhizobium mongolense]|uniref:Streptomycin 6-kinase n=2 Tax=Rhizobium mongolense TaxID=57676 RepID=A0ABR6IMP7_9HYPH|nr:aminoglycoside phosphotransferase family protein [Rhizobium mongolense]MBB4229164.1 streptomycin 6-kinase [Rhizobium mongolense]TVZ63284.1 streptomycin 6-kinase [Rhizobium mongolense USDA 1844]
MFESHLDRWSLAPDGEPIITHSSHLLPVLWNGKPAMLKKSRDVAERAGGALMHWWDGGGAAKVYAHDDEAVLLERATGGRSLLKMAMDGEDDEASRIICRTVERLHAPRQKPLPGLIPLRRWFRELAPAARTYGGILPECSAIAETLLSDPRDPVVLHGDIHHSNILDFEEDGWLAIDPKGLIGERGFDYANTFANEDLPAISVPGRLRRQLRIVCAETGMEPKRLLQWIAAYSGLSAAWFLGDNMNTSAENPLSVARIALAELRQA